MGVEDKMVKSSFANVIFRKEKFVVSACEMTLYHLFKFKVCKSMHHHKIQINQPTRCNSLSSLLLDVYVQFNMFRASSRPSSGAQQLQ